MNSEAPLETETAIFDSPDDRLLIRREASADPRFARKVAQMLREPDGEEKVAIFAKQAILNELDPRQFPETRGYWTLLRTTARKIVDELPAAIARGVAKMTPAEREHAAQMVKAGGTPLLVPNIGELGQFEIIGSLVGAVAGAASSIYGNYLMTSTQKQIASMQLDAQQKQLDAQIAMANAQIAMSNAKAAQAAEASILPAAIVQPVQAVASALSTEVAGLPLWLLILGSVFALKYGKFV